MHKWECTVFREPFGCSLLINAGKIRTAPQCKEKQIVIEVDGFSFLYTYLHEDPEYRFFSYFSRVYPDLRNAFIASVFTLTWIVIMTAKVLIPAPAGYPLPLLMAHLSLRQPVVMQISKTSNISPCPAGCTGESLESVTKWDNSHDLLLILGSELTACIWGRHKLCLSICIILISSRQQQPPRWGYQWDWSVCKRPAQRFLSDS